MSALISVSLLLELCLSTLLIVAPFSIHGYRVKKASPQTLNRIKRLINQQLQSTSGKANALLQSDPIFIEQKYPESKPHHDELSVNDPEKYFQGDVDLSEEQAQILSDELELQNIQKLQLEDHAEIRKKRKIGREPLYVRWNRNQPISYDFDRSVPPPTREKIKAAIKLWERNTCVRFRENGPSIDRIEFFDGGGCSSFVGKTGGTQGVSISTPGCDNVGIISHEIGHALGIFHEQARPDQNDNIYVNYQNIPVNRWNNFQPVSNVQADTFGLPYDAGSVMHYGPYGFATDPYVATIVTRDRSLQSTIGQREGPSFLDFQAINKAYRCTENCPQLECAHGGYVNPNNCIKCLCPNGFSGQFCEIVQSSSCGGMINVTTKPRLISSPNYPGYYPQDTECIWLLKAYDGGKVYFEFSSNLDLSCEDTCDRSYVEVKNNIDFRKTGYRFCCARTPTRTFESKNNEMVIIFRSKKYSSRGFEARVWSDTENPYQKETEATINQTTTTTATTTAKPTITTIVTTKPAIWATTTHQQLTTITSTTALPTTASVTVPTEIIATTVPTTSAPFWLTVHTIKSTSGFTSVSTGIPFWLIPSTTVAPSALITATDTSSDCKCSGWSEWTSNCTQQCGGCGKRTRKRWCNAPDCRTEEKRACNFGACPPGTNFLINNGEFHILWKGCCVGLFRSGSDCTSLEDEENPFLTIITSLLSSQDAKRNATGILNVPTLEQDTMEIKDQRFSRSSPPRQDAATMLVDKFINNVLRGIYNKKTKVSTERIRR